MAAPPMPLNDYTGVPSRQFFGDTTAFLAYLQTNASAIDMTGGVPALGEIPAGFGMFRYTQGGALTFYGNNAGALVVLVLGTPS